MDLMYWPIIPGRGEFIRLLFEDSGIQYNDKSNVSEIVSSLQTSLAFAFPLLKHNDMTISQTATILRYIAHALGLDSSYDEFLVDMIQLTISDFVSEIHNTHHPIAVAKYFEEQKDEAKKYSSFFIQERVPKFLDYFERLLSSGDGYLASSFSYVDLSLFHTLCGLEYAFPNAYSRIIRSYPKCATLRDIVSKRPNIATYLASDRRRPFSNAGIFRHYIELDEQ